MRSHAKLPMKCVAKEYPNKLNQTIVGPDELQPPKALHPSFYGCFDWHSTVHGHWMLVHLLKLFPNMPEAPAIRVALGQNLSGKNIAGEVAYLKQANRASFERTYGWAWLLKLAEELHGWNDEDGKRWSANLQPLAAALVEKYLTFLPKQNYPIRTGVHPNTAFGLAFALDYANAVNDLFDDRGASGVESEDRSSHGSSMKRPSRPPVKGPGTHPECLWSRRVTPP